MTGVQTCALPIYDEGAVPGHWLVPETSGVVDEGVLRAHAVGEPADDAPARDLQRTRPEEHSSQRRCWPHGGRQRSRGELVRCHKDMTSWGRWTLEDSGEG